MRRRRRYRRPLSKWWTCPSCGLSWIIHSGHSEAMDPYQLANIARRAEHKARCR